MKKTHLIALLAGLCSTSTLAVEAPFFIGLETGANRISTDSTREIVGPPRTIESNSFSYSPAALGIHLGYHITEQHRLKLSYRSASRNKFSRDISIDDTLLAYDYLHPLSGESLEVQGLYLAAGLSLGQSDISVNGPDGNGDTEEFVWGAQLLAGVKVTPHVMLEAGYQYLDMGNASLLAGTEAFSFDDSHRLIVSLDYRF